MIVVLPGSGYTAQGPALLIPALALAESGFGPVVSITYATLPLEVSAADIVAVEETVLAAINQRVQRDLPGRVVFVAKSFGTQVLGRIAPRLSLEGVDVAAVWVTPLFGREGRADEAIATSLRSLIVAGSADTMHHHQGHARVVRELKAAELIVADADHGLEVAGDVRATVAGFAALADRTLAFASSLS